MSRLDTLVNKALCDMQSVDTRRERHAFTNAMVHEVSSDAGDTSRVVATPQAVDTSYERHVVTDAVQVEVEPYDPALLKEFLNAHVKVHTESLDSPDASADEVCVYEVDGEVITEAQMVQVITQWLKYHYDGAFHVVSDKVHDNDVRHYQKHRDEGAADYLKKGLSQGLSYQISQTAEVLTTYVAMRKFASNYEAYFGEDFSISDTSILVASLALMCFQAIGVVRNNYRYNSVSAIPKVRLQKAKEEGERAEHRAKEELCFSESNDAQLEAFSKKLLDKAVNPSMLWRTYCAAMSFVTKGFATFAAFLTLWEKQDPYVVGLVTCFALFFEPMIEAGAKADVMGNENTRTVAYEVHGEISFQTNSHFLKVADMAPFVWPLYELASVGFTYLKGSAAAKMAGLLALTYYIDQIPGDGHEKEMLRAGLQTIVEGMKDIFYVSALFYGAGVVRKYHLNEMVQKKWPTPRDFKFRDLDVIRQEGTNWPLTQFIAQFMPKSLLPAGFIALKTYEMLSEQELKGHGVYSIGIAFGAMLIADILTASATASVYQLKPDDFEGCTAPVRAVVVRTLHLLGKAVNGLINMEWVLPRQEKLKASTSQGAVEFLDSLHSRDKKIVLALSAASTLGAVAAQSPMLGGGALCLTAIMGTALRAPANRMGVQTTRYLFSAVGMMFTAFLELMMVVVFPLINWMASTQSNEDFPYTRDAFNNETLKELLGTNASRASMDHLLEKFTPEQVQLAPYIVVMAMTALVSGLAAWSTIKGEFGKIEGVDRAVSDEPPVADGVLDVTSTRHESYGTTDEHNAQLLGYQTAQSTFSSRLALFSCEGAKAACHEVGKGINWVRQQLTGDPGLSQ